MRVRKVLRILSSASGRTLSCTLGRRACTDSFFGGIEGETARVPGYDYDYDICHHFQTMKESNWTEETHYIPTELIYNSRPILTMYLLNTILLIGYFRSVADLDSDARRILRGRPEKPRSAWVGGWYRWTNECLEEWMNEEVTVWMNEWLAESNEWFMTEWLNELRLNNSDFQFYH